MLRVHGQHHGESHLTKKAVKRVKKVATSRIEVLELEKQESDARYQDIQAQLHDLSSLLSSREDIDSDESIEVDLLHLQSHDNIPTNVGSLFEEVETHLKRTNSMGFDEEEHEISANHTKRAIADSISGYQIVE